MFGKVSDRRKGAASEADRERVKSLREETNYAVDVQDLTIHYETGNTVVKAVNSIDIRLKKKSVMGIVGETGAGKTTAMLSLMRLVPNPPGVIKSGKIVVNGIDMSKLAPRELGVVRGKEISMIFQDPMTSLNPVMTVGDQIAESIALHEGLGPNVAMERAKEILETVGIPPERAHEYPHQFSGGMRQRVGIAIALACRPSVLIADEPTTALDVTIQAQVLKLMRELKNKYDASMLLITHDLGIVAQMCDEIAVMYAGRIIEKGTVEDIFNNFKHPYTEGLFNSLPNINNKVHRLQPIRGQMPDPTNLSDSCAFAPRCPYVTEECKKGWIEAKTLSDTHSVTCCAYNNPDFSLKGADIRG
jgi:peptide/nickel transport system ATP-binding protein